ncbi:hypothetical protein LLG96_14730 [bacterium]|nr:hypothetical protein [bacterium]
MQRLSACFILLCLCLGAHGCSKKAETPAAVHPGDMFISAVIGCLDQSATQLDTMNKAAEAAAARAVKGGRIYVTDDETLTGGTTDPAITKDGTYYLPINNTWGGFVTEAYGRAGGLTKIYLLPQEGKLTAQDVVLAGTMELNPEAQIKLLGVLKDMGAMVIVFGSRDSRAAGIADYVIDNGLAPGTSPVMHIGQDAVTGPIAGIANIIDMWVFTAEYVAALTREGKMPAMWQSMFVPGAAPRNKRVDEFTFHPDLTISPVEAGVLGRQYITAVKGFLENIRANEMNKFHDAGKLCAETILSGKKVEASLIGHFMASQQRMPEFPHVFTVNENGFGPDHLNGLLDPGDVWLHVGYSYYPEQELLMARAAGAKTICVFTPGPAVLGEGSPLTPDMGLIDIYIDPYWKHGDTTVNVPGYDINFIPPSGVVMTTCYWMLIGETVFNLPPGKQGFSAR